MNKYYIADKAFEKIFLYLKGRKDVYCKTQSKIRTFLESVYFIMRTGVQWIELPQNYGKYKTIHTRSNRKKPRKVDYYLYKERHLIECFFGKLKHFGRIFSRFDKMAQAYMGFLAFASTII